MNIKIKTNKGLNKLMTDLRLHFDNHYSSDGSDAFYSIFSTTSGGIGAACELVGNALKDGKEVYDVDNCIMVGSLREIKLTFKDIRTKIDAGFIKENADEERAQSLVALIQKSCNVDIRPFVCPQFIDLLLDEKKMELVMRALKNRTFG